MQAQGFEGRDCSTGKFLSALQETRHQVHQLRGGELVSFDVGGEAPLAIDHDGVKRVGEKPFVEPVGDAEEVTDFVDGFGRASEEMPGRGVGFPDLGILGEHGGGVAGGGRR